MDKKLYIERWLLLVKAAALQAGLNAHVRAVDVKGGRLVALEIRNNREALELRYRKRRIGPRVLAAATSAEIIPRVRRVFEKVLAEHGKLLENGLRRFLRRSLKALKALETAFVQNTELLSKVTKELAEAPRAHARPALVVQPRTRDKVQSYPAIAQPRGSGVHFMAWNMNRLLDLSYLFPGQAASLALGVPASPSQVRLQAAGLTDTGVELIQPQEAAAGRNPRAKPEQSGWLDEAIGEAADGALDVLTSGSDRLSGTPRSVSGPIGAETQAPAGPELGDLADSGGTVGEATDAGLEGLGHAAGALEGVGHAGGAAAEVGMDGLSAAAEALGSAAEVGGAVAESAGSAAEVVAGGGECLGDAACSGIDLGGLDCSF